MLQCPYALFCYNDSGYELWSAPRECTEGTYIVYSI